MSTISCRKEFTLTIQSCLINCLPSATVTFPATEQARWSAFAANSGRIYGGGGTGADPAVIHIINPDTHVIENRITLGVAETPACGIYHPFTQRIITAHFSAAIQTVIRVINPLTIAVEDSAIVAGQTPKMVSDEVNNRVYVGTNSGPCALYAFDVVTHAAPQIAVGSTTLGAVAFSEDDNYIFFAGDSNSIRVLSGVTFGLIATLAVIGGNATFMAYCPANRCLYAAIFNLSLLRVWKLDSLIATNTTADFVVPGTSSTVAVQVVTTTDMLADRAMTINGSHYTIVSVDSGVQVTVRNIDAPPTTLVTAPAAVSFEGIAFLTDIALGSNSAGLAWDSRFGRIINGSFALTLVNIINPATQTLDCTVGYGTSVSFGTLGNSGCKAFIPANSKYGTLV